MKINLTKPEVLEIVKSHFLAKGMEVDELVIDSNEPIISLDRLEKEIREKFSAKNVIGAMTYLREKGGLGISEAKKIAERIIKHKD